MSEMGQKLIRRYGELKADRANWESHWQDIAEFVLPNTDFTTAKEPGAERRQRIFNNTPGEALERLVGGMGSLLTNQSLKWFDLSIRNLVSSDEGARWLSQGRDRTLAILNDPEVNLYATLDECYESLGGFGTGVVYVENEVGLKFRSVPLSSCYIAESYMGMVDTLYRKLELTVRQAIQMFGEESLPGKIQDELRATSDTDRVLGRTEVFIHCVGPREDYDPTSPFAFNKPFYSVTVHESTKEVVKESGFDRFPYFVPRWRRSSGEKYGRSPGIKLLQDIRVLNAVSKSALSAASKEADPPVQMPDSGFLRPARLGPGGLNIYRSSSQGRIEPIQTGARSDRAYAIIERVEERIRQGFYNDMFHMPEIDRMTATEVLQRQQQNQQLFSPTLNRLFVELLNPIVFEGYDYATRVGAIEPPPEGLEDRPIEVHYTSPLARAQKASEMGSFLEWFGALAPMAEIDPSVMDNIHPDRTARRLGHAVSLPEQMSRSDAELAEVRQQRAQQQQEAQQMQQAVDGAGALKDAAQGISALR